MILNEIKTLKDLMINKSSLDDIIDKPDSWIKV